MIRLLPRLTSPRAGTRARAAFPLLAGILLVLPVASCGSTPAKSSGGSESPLPARGLTVVPYHGTFEDAPAMAGALARLPALVSGAEKEVSSRLGLSLDPDLPLRLVLVDDRETVAVDSRLTEGRRVQVIQIPVPAVAGKRAKLSTEVLEGICRAVLLDSAPGELPDWYVKGAPLWITGGYEKALARTVLLKDPVPTHTGSIAGKLDLSGDRTDALTGALFLRFLAVEFGAERVSGMTRAFLSGATFPAAIRAAFGTDPDSVPTAFDGFRTKVVADLIQDPVVRELSAARSLPPEARLARLTGLGDREENAYVVAVIEEETGEAQYDAKHFAAAAQTFAAIERDRPRFALTPDRDRLHFALSFLSRGKKTAAALRLESFLADFPESGLCPRALYELGTIDTALGRTKQGSARFREILFHHRHSPYAVRAAIELATRAEARGRYSEAMGDLEGLPSDSRVEALRARIARETAGGLPRSAEKVVADAVRNLSSPDDAAGKKAVETLVDVGPVAAATVEELLDAPVDEWPLPDYRTRALAIARRLGGPAGDGILRRLLLDPEGDVGTRAVDILLDQGVSADSIRALIRPGTPAAKEMKKRLAAAKGLGDLASAVTSPDFHERISAAGQLRFVAGPAAVGALEKLAADDSPQVRAAAARAIAARSEPEFRKVLELLLKDKAADVRGAALAAANARGNRELVVKAGLGSTDPAVRVAAAKMLLVNPRPSDVARVVALLGDHNPGVRKEVELLLRVAGGPTRAPALAEALRKTTDRGHAMRIIRVMAALAGTDFGYDLSGSRKERDRVATAFLAAWPKQSH